MKARSRSSAPAVRTGDASLAWGHDLEEVVSKGSVTTNEDGLAGIAKAREIHQGQFFTPVEVSARIRDLAANLVAGWLKERPDPIRIMDTSIGSGRLERTWDPREIEVHGCDIDKQCIAPLKRAAEDAGCYGSMDDIHMETLLVRGKRTWASSIPLFPSP
jgi:hypothetical protein